MRFDWAEASAYLAAALGSLLAAAWVLNLWRADLSVPFTYAGDSLFTSAFTKGLIECGSFVRNPALGAPGASVLLDYPGMDAAHQVFLRLLGWLTGNWATAVNAYFLLSFALTGITSMLALRALGARRAPAITFAILYSVLPFHFMRNEGHLFLGAYWAVPLAVLACLWLIQDTPLMFQKDGAWKLDWHSKRALPALLVCLLLGASGVYYAFFACFCLVVVGISAWVRKASRQRMVAALILVAVICLSAGLGVAESVRYRIDEGPNVEVAERWPGESIRYALRLPQTLLPITGHRVAALATIREKYHSVLSTISPDSDNENDSASLGIVLGLSFVALIGAALWPHPSGDSTVRLLAELNLAGFLLATVDGFGAIFAMLISPQIRAYNRISVYIGFFAAALAALALSALARRWEKRPVARVSVWGICVLIVVFGVLDQTSPAYAPSYDAVREAHASDAQFVESIEALLPARAMVFQLPYVPFPESGPVVNLPDYDHFRAYLHSDDLSWSYGAMRGRESDLWQRQVTALPVSEFIDEIRTAGFRGIWIDTRGYADGGEMIIAETTTVLGTEPLTSDDGRVVFFEVP